MTVRPGHSRSWIEAWSITRATRLPSGENATSPGKIGQLLGSLHLEHFRPGPGLPETVFTTGTGCEQAAIRTERRCNGPLSGQQLGDDLTTGPIVPHSDPRGPPLQFPTATISPLGLTHDERPPGRRFLTQSRHLDPQRLRTTARSPLWKDTTRVRDGSTAAYEQGSGSRTSAGSCCAPRSDSGSVQSRRALVAPQLSNWRSPETKKRSLTSPVEIV